MIDIAAVVIAVAGEVGLTELLKFLKGNKKQHRNPLGPKTGDRRVLRGGSWFFFGLFLPCSFRYGLDPEGRNFNIGFRVVCGA